MGSRHGRHLKGVLLVALPLLGLVAAPGRASSWRVERGPSAVGFTVSHLVFSEVDGKFTRFSGAVELPGDDFERARIQADIQASSIRTGHRDRDEHLRSDEFLYAEAFPTIRFVSRAVERTGEDAYRIVGDLTIRDVTREIVLAATSMGRRETSAGPRLDFMATGKLNRYDYGLRWNKLWDGSVLLGEEVEISLKVCLVESEEAGSEPGETVGVGMAATSPRP